MPKIPIGTAALMIAVLAAACSTSNNATGSGGSGASGGAGTTGVAGTTGGAGTTGIAGAAGTGGAGGSDSTDDGGAFAGTPDAAAPYTTPCAATVKNKGICMTATDVQCANTCGPNKIGFKNCNCYSDVWDCPKCDYVPGNYSCYHLPDPLEACPADEESDSGSTLPMVGSPCTRAACSPCGSATLISYLDSASAAKVGYCICSEDRKWTCASTTEWPQ